MKYNDKIYFNEDIINAYADKRKGMKRQEVEDLLRCLIGFLKNDIKYDKQYAYDIPSIGQLYIPFKTVDDMITEKSINTDRYDKIVFEYMLNIHSPVRRKGKFRGMTREEIQQKNNEETQ